MEQGNGRKSLLLLKTTNNNKRKCYLINTSSVIINCFSPATYGNPFRPCFTSAFLFSRASRVSLMISRRGLRRCGLATASANISVTCSKPPYMCSHACTCTVTIESAHKSKRNSSCDIVSKYSYI